MKTKKYESIMNKAMKAAMNYENPDDQINEFIRFFGEHIGSERIYIFVRSIIYLKIILEKRLLIILMSGVRMGLSLR